nr:ribonuclease H-like domain-containing protein [Tanacetum cinerariifolium]
MEAIRIFLAFATYMNFKVYQMDVKSAFLNVKTPMVPLNNLGPDLAGKPVNETLYRGMIGSLIPQVMSAAKLPILNPNELDLWKIRIKQYFLMTDYSLSEDAKTLMEAIEKRFGGNKETKKVQKTLLKQQYENFTSSSSERLDQIHDRLQKLINLEEQSLNDLFNSLKIYEAEDKSSSSAGTSTQNIAFVSSQTTDSTNDQVSVVASVSTTSAKILVSALPNVDILRRNLGANGPTSMGFDMSKVECYNCHRKGHFVRECRSPKDTRRNGAAEPQRRNVPAEEEPTNYALMAFTSSSSSSSDNELRDNALVVLRQKFEKIEQERDDFKIKLEMFQTLSKNLSQLLASQTNDKIGLGYNTQVFTSFMFNCDEMFTSETNESLPASPTYDRYHSGDGYHAVPPPSTGTFMPLKPDLVFNDAPNVNETNHSAFNVKLSPTKPDTNLSHTHRPSTPIIEDWVFDSKEDSETGETSILAANHKTAIPKPKSNGNNRNRKACFVCKSLTHLIQDCDYYDKKMAQTPARTHAQRGNHQQYAKMALPNPQQHVVLKAVLTKSKLVPITAVRPVTAVVPKTHVTRPRPAKIVLTNPHSPPRRTINCSLSPKASTFPLKVTAATTPMVNAVKGVQGNWDKGVIDSVCSSHITGNMSYVSDFEELNGRYVAFGGNLKGGLTFNLFSVSQMCDKKNNVLFTDIECLVLSPEFKLPDENQVLLRVSKENNMYNVDLKNIVPSRDLTCLFVKAMIKGIKREFSVPRTPQQNGIAERKNKTLIEATRTMLEDSLLPILFWAEAVNTACFVQNRLLVTKPQNKTPYELLLGRTPSIGFMRPFGCFVTILNTLDPLGKFDRKDDEGFFVGYYVSSKAFRVFNSRSRIVQETLHINYLENKPNVAGSGPTWLFDIDTVTKTMNYQPVTTRNQSNNSAGKEPEFEGRKPESEVHVYLSSCAQTKKHDDKTKREDNVGNKMHKAFPLLGESSHWQYKFPLPVEGVPTASGMEI